MEYLVKNGTMRVVLEIKEEKHQIKSLRKMLAGDDEMEFVELSTRFADLVTKKCDTILEIIADEKRLEEERDQASQLRNRIKGTGNSRGYGGYGGYSSESYDAVGSDSRKKKQNDDPYRGYGGNSYGNRDRDRERERDRDRDRDYGGSSNTGGRYDAHQGGSNLMKKLGIAADADKPKDDDDDIEFPEDEKPSKITAPPKKEEPKPAPVFTKPTAGAKFLPPPPSKSGAPVAATSTAASVSTSQASTNDGFDLLGGDLLDVKPTPSPTPAPQTAQPSNLLGFDLTSPQPAATPAQGNQFSLLGNTNPQPSQQLYGNGQNGANNLLGAQNGGFGYQPAANGFQSSGNGNFGSFGGNMGQQRPGFGGVQGGFGAQQPMGMQGGLGGNFGGMGSYGAQNMGMGAAQTGFGGMGANQGFGQQQGSFGMGMGAATSQTTYGGSAQQSGKLITFGNKPSGGNDLLGGSQDSRPKTLVRCLAHIRMRLVWKGSQT